MTEMDIERQGARQRARHREREGEKYREIEENSEGETNIY